MINAFTISKRFEPVTLAVADIPRPPREKLIYSYTAYSPLITLLNR